MKELHIGLKGHYETLVTPENTASRVRSVSSVVWAIGWRSAIRR